MKFGGRPFFSYKIGKYAANIYGMKYINKTGDGNK